MKPLNERQLEIRSVLGEITKIPDNDSWGAFTDFLRSVAAMIEGSEHLVDPSLMSEYFSGAWDSYIHFFAAENVRILVSCLGSHEEYERVKNHPNGMNVMGNILKRFEETHGFEVGTTSKVEVMDILYKCDCLPGGGDGGDGEYFSDGTS